ncbi:glycosyltransferase [candidate division KSB1 bacterium]|nr:glycosyltransferase [candidate division KSB1 bacterium]
MDVIEIILFGLTGFYFLVVLWLNFGVYYLRRVKSQHKLNKDKPFISIIVAARNEEKTIKECIKALINQNYPKELYEVIIVNDRSEDKTGEIVKSYLTTHPNLHLIEIEDVPDDYMISPKKYALTRGISISKGEIICTTDADCFPSQYWIAEMVKYFDSNVGFVAGYSPIEGNGFINRLIQFDNLSIISAGAGGIGGGYPILCAGRNLAYRRKAFDEVGGFSEIKQFDSGDDDLLMMLIRDRTHWKFRFASSEGSFVNTVPPFTLIQILRQRMRWASKGLHYSLPMTAALSAVFFYNLLLLITVPSFILGLGFSTIPIISFAIKTVSEFFLLYQTSLLLKESKLMSYFPISALLHIPYLVFFGIWGTFVNVKWKS